MRERLGTLHRSVLPRPVRRLVRGIFSPLAIIRGCLPVAVANGACDSSSFRVAACGVTHEAGRGQKFVGRDAYTRASPERSTTSGYKVFQTQVCCRYISRYDVVVDQFIGGACGYSALEARRSESRS
jgi:hypothetical protein